MLHVLTVHRFIVFLINCCFDVIAEIVQIIEVFRFPSFSEFIHQYFVKMHSRFCSLCILLFLCRLKCVSFDFLFQFLCFPFFARSFSVLPLLPLSLSLFVSVPFLRRQSIQLFSVCAQNREFIISFDSTSKRISAFFVSFGFSL